MRKRRPRAAPCFAQEDTDCRWLRGWKLRTPGLTRRSECSGHQGLRSFWGSLSVPPCLTPSAARCTEVLEVEGTALRLSSPVAAGSREPSAHTHYADGGRATSPCGQRNASPRPRPAACAPAGSPAARPAGSSQGARVLPRGRCPLPDMPAVTCLCDLGQIASVCRSRILLPHLKKVEGLRYLACL